MTITPLALNTLPRVEKSVTQNSQQNRPLFSRTLDNVQHSSLDRADEARKVVRLVQDCMLGKFTHQEEDMDLLASYDFIRPFTPHGYDAYRPFITASSPVYPADVQESSFQPSKSEDSTQPSPPEQGTLRARIEKLIDQVAQRVGLPAILVRSVVSTESAFRPDAVSPVGAQGLMQLMPETANELGVVDSFDPQQNLLGGSRYLKELLQKYDGDLDHALAAYNWGQGNVDRKGLAQMPTETRDYIAKVKQVASQFG